MRLPGRHLESGRLLNQSTPVVLAVATLLVGTRSVFAHEEYVVEDGHDVTTSGFLTDAFTDPFVVGPLAIGAFAIAAAAVAYRSVRPFQRDVASARSVLGEYDEYVAVLLRFSFGLPLIGAGFAGFFISPSVPADARLLQVMLGFLLLCGLATRLVALVALSSYVVGVCIRPELLLHLEYLGGLFAVVLTGSGRPSVDHVFVHLATDPTTAIGRTGLRGGRVWRLREQVAHAETIAPTVVRIGLGTAFVYIGVTQTLLTPGMALAVVEKYQLTAVVPVSAHLWVAAAGLFKTTLGFAFVFGVFTRFTAAATLSVFTLTLFALPDDPVVAHVALFGMATVLLITGSGPFAIDNRIEAVEADLDAPTPTAA